MNNKGIPGIEFSNKHKHLMMRRIYSSFAISQERKDRLLEKLTEEDKSDWSEKTKAFCLAAVPT